MFYGGMGKPRHADLLAADIDRENADQISRPLLCDVLHRTADKRRVRAVVKTSKAVSII